MLIRRFTSHFRNHDWFAVSLDFVVVVLGIFVGLQVDNWNQLRVDKAEEELLLEALAEDFIANAELLAGARSQHELVADAGQAIITYGEAGTVPQNERDRFERLLSNHGSRYAFVPVMAAVENILGTEKINLISSRELIALLRRWPQLVAELYESEIAAREHYHDRIYPYLASRIDFEDHDKGFKECCFNDPDTGEVGINRMEYPWNQQPSDAYLLVEDQEFLNIIYWHWVHSMNILQGVRDVDDSLQAIQQVVAQELAR
jgi:hypothetical protein